MFTYLPLRMVCMTNQQRRQRLINAGVMINVKLQALVYDILPLRKVPESEARSVDQRVSEEEGCNHWNP